MRRAGAAYMHSLGLSLEDIREAGDWSSMAALLYLAKPMSNRIVIDSKVSQDLCNLCDE